MDFNAFLNRVIDDGTAACKIDYADRPDKLKGAVEGFEACRGKGVEELITLLNEAGKAMGVAMISTPAPKNYWEIRCYEAEIEWVCNCVSAALVNQGQRPIVPVTARGMIKAAEVLGVST